MSKKNSFTTSDYLDFDKALNTGRKLLKEKPIVGLYIIVSIYTGLRVSDVLNLKWSDLQSDIMNITEKKTKKRKQVKVNDVIKDSIKGFPVKGEKVFLSQKGSVYSIQSINRILKDVFKAESKKFNISSHSLRKTFGRRVWENDNQSERALIYLSKLFNHTSIAETRKYLGITQEELNDIYMSL